MRTDASSVKLVLLPVLAAIITICSPNGPATAGNVNLADYTFSEYMVNADPGEDPHLKIDPDINVFTLPVSLVQSAPPVSLGDERDILRAHEQEPKRATRWYSRVDHKFRMMFHKIVLTMNW